MSELSFNWSVSLTNPMVQAHGTGPDGMRCRQCAFLHQQMISHAPCTCTLRGLSTNAASAHQRHWPACRKFMRDSD